MILTLDIGRRDADLTGIAQVQYSTDGTMTMIKSDTFDLNRPSEMRRLAAEFGLVSNRPEMDKVLTMMRDGKVHV